MTRTLFGKLFILITSALVVTFTITGISLYLYLQISLTSQKVTDLKRSAEQVSNLYNEYLQYGNDSSFSSLFKRTLTSIEQNTGALIWITDIQGRVLEWTPSIKAVENELDVKGNYFVLPDKRQIEAAVKNGEDIHMSGDFYGLFKQYGKDILTVAELKKVTFISGDENYIVYLFVRIPEVFYARENAIKMYGIWGSLAIFATLLIVYFITRRITKPVKEMSLATTMMAKGVMGQRISQLPNDEIGELARSFNSMAQALENLENMRRDFVANVSHELRSPMTSMRGFIEAMLDGTILQEDQDKYLKIVRDETLRLSFLVNDLLDLSKMQSGKLITNITTFDINELIRRSVITLESLINQKDLELTTEFKNDPCLVQGDRPLVERVLINLISNGIKFTKNEIRISTWQDGNNSFVKISDDGCGMNDDDVSQVFERFYKADKSRSSDKLGSGLGLSIVREIVRLHGGEISVQSTLDVGSSFVFFLPTKKNS